MWCRAYADWRSHGVDISCSTMCDWMAFTTSLLTPIYDEMKRKILRSKVIWTDDTSVYLQDRKQEKNIRQARILAYLGDAENNLLIYDFTDSRKREGPVNFLQGFEGFLQADAYACYDGICAGNLVQCGDGSMPIRYEPLKHNIDCGFQI